MEYGKIESHWGLRHFLHGTPRNYTLPLNITGWMGGKQVSSLAEIIPADRWVIHYIPYTEDVRATSPNESFPTIEHIILIDNCGQPYEFTRDLRTCRHATYTFRWYHGAALKDPAPLPPCFVDLYKTVATQNITLLCSFTRSLYTIAAQLTESEDARTAATLALAASATEKEALRAEVAKCKADLLALI